MPKGKWRIVAPRNGPIGTGIGRVEDPRGEGMMYVVGRRHRQALQAEDQEPDIRDVSAAPKMLIGYKVADVVAIMGGLDMCIGETDR